MITAAAAVMVAVFGAFALSGNRTLELFGVVMATAVFLDAFVIRMVLLPAVLELLGRRTWAFPRGLDRRLPRRCDRTAGRRAARPGRSPRSRRRRDATPSSRVRSKRSSGSWRTCVPPSPSSPAFPATRSCPLMRTFSHPISTQPAEPNRAEPAAA